MKFITKLPKENIFRDLLNKSLISIFIKATSGFLMYFLTILLVNEIGAEESGIFFYGFSFIIIVSAFSRFGFDLFLLKEISRHKASLDTAKINSLVLFSILFIFSSSLLISLLMYFLLLIYPSFLSSTDSYSVLRIFIFSLVLISSVNVFRLILQGLGKISFSLLLENTVYSIIMIVFLQLFNFSEALSVAYIFLLSNFFCFILGIVLLLNSQKITYINFYDVFSQIYNIKESFFYWITTNTSVILQWLSIVILGLNGMYIEASLFMAAQQTSVLTAFIFLATDKAFSPQIAELFTLKKDYEAKKLIVFTARMMLLFSLPLLFVLIIFSNQVLMLFGQEYMAAKFALIFLTFAQFSRVLSGNSYSILAMQGLTIKLSNISLTVLPISIILNIILINFYGLNGAALSTGITIFIYHYLCFYAARKSLGYYPFFLSK